MAKLIKNPIIVITPGGGGGGGSNEAFKSLVDKSITAVTAEDFDDVTSIGDYTFYGCIELESVEFPTALTAIGNSAFLGCSGLIAVYITDLAAWCAISFGNESANPLRYAHNLYLNNTRVIALSIPSGVTSIGNYVFYGSSPITSVTIPASVASIGNEAFAYCSGIASIEVASGNATYHDDGDCLIHTASETLVLGCKNSVIPIDGSVTIIGNYAFAGCDGLSTDIEIPSGVTSIGNGAFKDCTTIETITIPISVTNIGSHAFDGCSSLAEIIFLGGLASWDAITKGTGWDANTGSYTITFSFSEGLVFTSNGNGTCYVSDIGTCTDTDIIIPSTSPDGDTVTGIGSNAFKNNVTITSVDIPTTTTYIGTEAFNGCRGLTSITIPNSVKRIEDRAFRYCGFTSITIPDSVTDIGAYWTFGDCYNLTKVILSSGVSQILYLIFANCTSLSTFVIRRKTSIVTLGDTTLNKNALYFVPLSLINDYKVATNWVTYESRFRPAVDTVADLSSIDTTVYTEAWVYETEKEYTYDGTQWNEVQ